MLFIYVDAYTIFAFTFGTVELVLTEAYDMVTIGSIKLLTFPNIP